MDIITLHRRGMTQRAIARELGISRNTVTKYIENPDLAFNRPKRQPRPSQLDPSIFGVKSLILKNKISGGQKH